MDHADLKANGRLSTTYIMSLQRFIHPSNRARFAELQGSELFANFLRHGLRPNGRFSPHPSETTLEQQGHALNIFRRRLITHYFFPAYVPNAALTTALNKALGTNLPENGLVLGHWAFSLRLTHTGQVIVQMVWDVQDLPLIEITRTLLYLQGAIPLNAHSVGQRVTQWQVAMDMVAAFVEACGGQFVIGASKNGRFPRHLPIQLTTDYDIETSFPLHDRHLTFLFDQLTLNGRSLTADDLRHAFAPHLFGLLQNSLVVENGRYTYPAFNPNTVAALFAHDHANWQHELCLLTPEASLIYAPATTTTPIYFDSSHLVDHAQSYTHYWQSIARGIEFFVTLKNEVQMLERITTEQLAKVPHLTAKVADGNLSRADTQDILKLAQNIGRLFHMLPQMRDLLVPSSLFRTTHAVQIFSHYLNLLGIGSIERHIETNVQELNAFLAYYNGMQLQYDAQKTNKTILTLTIVFSMLTIMLSLIAIPSFFQDAQSLGWFTLDPANTTSPLVPTGATMFFWGSLAIGLSLLIIVAFIAKAAFSWLWAWYYHR